MSLLPYIAIGAAIVFFVLKASGVLDRLADLGKDRPAKKRNWGRELLENAKEDPDLIRRLQVFKDFLEDQSAGDDSPEQD